MSGRQSLSLAVVVLLLLVLLLVGEVSAAPRVEAPIMGQTLTQRDGPLDRLQMLVPFYEGLEISGAPGALAEAGLSQFELGYPGALSAPFVAWRFGTGAWTVLYGQSIADVPVALDVKAGAAQVEVELKSLAPGSLAKMEVKGDWPAVAAALRKAWNPRAAHRALGRDFKQLHFYVHQWVADNGSPALRTDWTIDALAQRMKAEDPATLVFDYGFDPGSVDLGGRYFWSQGARDGVRTVLQANPRVSHMAWLNLRTFKTAIPRLDLTAKLPPELQIATRQFPAGTRIDAGQWSFKSVDMCLASEPWQRSRISELDALADLGFKVVQLDEFPIPSLWHVNACQAQGHLHKPNDAVDEWRRIMSFVAILSKKADERGIRLTCEEPSAALLPFVCGYVDRQYNQSIDLYAPWKKGKGIVPIPLFSTLFGDLATPYTDVEEAEEIPKPPARWLINYKQAVK